jgi:voltage-gated potassium channel
MRDRAIRILDSYASLLVLLLANFFLLEVVNDERWAVIGSTLLGAAALVVAISDPDTGHTVERRQWISIAVCVLLAPVVLVVNSQEVVGLTYLLPAALLVTATLPVTLVRVLRHQRVTYETVLGALCTYVLLGLLFAFAYFSFVTITTLGFGDLSPAVGLPQALTALEALLGSVFLVTLVARLVTLWVRQDEARAR